MNRQFPAVLFVVVCGLGAMFSAPALADHVVAAGQTLALTEDLVLTGNDSLDIQGTPDRRCTLRGNGHRIRSEGSWTGSVRIRHCDLRGLGAPAKLPEDGAIRILAEFPAVAVTAVG